MASKRHRLAQRRKAVGFSQEELARCLRVERTTVSRWENGESEPQPWTRPKLAQALRVSIDQLVGLLMVTDSDGPNTRSTEVSHEGLAGLEASPALDAVRIDGDASGRSVRESEFLLSRRPDAIDFGLLNEAATQLGVAYVANPPSLMLTQGLAIRRELLRSVEAAILRPSEWSDLYAAVGWASGVMAYAALDLDDPASAAIHAAVVWQMADISENDELKAWARGTQSLIARYRQEFVRAELFAEEGLRYARSAESRSRLIYAAAQCAANQGDSARTFELLDDAERVVETSEEENANGIFGFPIAKQKYYVASSLIWLPDGRSLTMAAESAEVAIDIWQHRNEKRHVLDDEALAHVYLATARLKLGEIDGAIEAVAPVIELDKDRRTSWMRRRIANLREILNESRFKGSNLTTAAHEALQEFESSS